MRCKNTKCQAETKNPKYCSKACSASVNNIGIRRRGNEAGTCERCQKPKYNYNRRFCSETCERLSHDEKQIQSLKDGTFVGHPTTLRKYVIKILGYSCQSCGIDSWLGHRVTLEVEHVDGDSTNNKLTNLKLLCPNCHSITPTYKSRNRGSGRAKRRERYQQGLSY